MNGNNITSINTTSSSSSSEDELPATGKLSVRRQDAYIIYLFDQKFSSSDHLLRPLIIIHSCRIRPTTVSNVRRPEPVLVPLHEGWKL
jgi:hypothetical protein